MKKNGKKKSLLNNTIVKVLLIQFLIFTALIFTDLLIFRGYFTSEIIINPNYWGNQQDYSCKLTIEKKENDKYLFKFKNNSLIPKYFLNYRFEECVQEVTDTLFFSYMRKNLFPAFGLEYYPTFDCGTGLGLTSINPLESFEIEKSYEDIIMESSYLDAFKNSSFFYEKMDKRYSDLEYKTIDSILKYESEIVTYTDSIQIEYFITMKSFISKSNTYTVSNKINVSLKDLLEKYLNKH